MVTVYIIRNVVEDRVLYVGKTKNFKRRKQEHLRLRTHTKDWIAAIGTDNVEIVPAAEFETKEEAFKYEDELICEYNTIENGYNKYRSGLIERGREKEYMQEYHQENADMRNERSKQWYQENTEYNKQQMKEWRQKNPEYNKQYYTDNAEKLKQYSRDRYHAKKLGMTVDEYRKREG